MHSCHRLPYLSFTLAGLKFIEHLLMGVFPTNLPTPDYLSPSNKCHASSNRCLTSSNKKLLIRILIKFLLLLVAIYLLIFFFIPYHRSVFNRSRIRPIICTTFRGAEKRDWCCGNFQKGCAATTLSPLGCDTPCHHAGESSTCKDRVTDARLKGSQKTMVCSDSSTSTSLVTSSIYGTVITCNH